MDATFTRWFCEYLLPIYTILGTTNTAVSKAEPLLRQRTHCSWGGPRSLGTILRRVAGWRRPQAPFLDSSLAGPRLVTVSLFKHSGKEGPPLSPGSPALLPITWPGWPCSA